MNYSGFKECFSEQGITLYLGDCMRLLDQTPDKYYSLCVCDPPYGIGNFIPQNLPKNGIKVSPLVEWNDSIPPEDYFAELARVSERQIIWGANYYNRFATSGGALIWHKGNINPIFSQCEIAALSWQKRVDYVHIDWQAGFARRKEGETIHPCQKPVALYRWLLQNYARPGDTILDTHLGSGSSAIAAWEMGYTFTGIEIDRDYFDAAVERIKKRMSQPYLPGIVQPKPEQTSMF